MSVIKLLLWLEESFLPSNETLALDLRKKKVSRINAELIMYGRSEMARSTFLSEMIAKAVKVIPIEKDPVLPTKILPAELKNARMSQIANGTISIIEFEPDKIISPTMIIAGQTVSKPLRPPSWFTVLVNMVTSSGIIRK
jgi:hypothetical protein